MTKKLIIAVDGPSGVGKGTISRRVAAALGYRHIDTGAMYRAVGWAALRAGVAVTAEADVARVAQATTIEIDDARVAVDGRDIAADIRTPEMDRAASAVSQLPRVRQILVDRQRALGADGGVVMEGRDIGTVVFPGADVKIYLDAAPEERARRRATDTAHLGGQGMSLDAVASEMAARDRADSTRAASPLRPAEDAHVVDTTGASIDEVVKRVLEIVNRLKAEG
ncbi:MAG: (d)CMP kinase [Bacteroidales bacterium]